jgi:hypothetical protein
MATDAITQVSSASALDPGALYLANGSDNFRALLGPFNNPRRLTADNITATDISARVPEDSVRLENADLRIYVKSDLYAASFAQEPDRNLSRPVAPR